MSIPHKGTLSPYSDCPILPRTIRYLVLVELPRRVAYGVSACGTRKGLKPQPRAYSGVTHSFKGNPTLVYECLRCKYVVYAIVCWYAGSTMASHIAPLTIKQKKFAAEVVKTGVATDAYRAAYNAENMAAPTVHVEAHRTLRLPQVNAEIQALLSDCGVEIDEIIDIQARNMRQDTHLPTSQRAAESLSEIVGLKTQAKAPSVAISFNINGSIEP